MKFAKLMMGLAAAALVTAPVLGQANDPEGEGIAEAGGQGLIIGALATAAIVGGLIIVSSGDGEPLSP